MSADLNVFIDKKKMLSSKEWMDAISKYGFNLKFEELSDLINHSGFLPCKYNGNVESGFELYFSGLDGTMFSEEANPEIKGKDLCVGFCSSYDQEYLASAMIASAVLAKECDGVFWLMDDFVSDDPIDMAKHIAEHGLGI